MLRTNTCTVFCCHRNEIIARLKEDFGYETRLPLTGPIFTFQTSQHRFNYFSETCSVNSAISLFFLFRLKSCCTYLRCYWVPPYRVSGIAMHWVMGKRRPGPGWAGPPFIQSGVGPRNCIGERTNQPPSGRYRRRQTLRACQSECHAG